MKIYICDGCEERIEPADDALTLQVRVMTRDSKRCAANRSIGHVHEGCIDRLVEHLQEALA